MTLPSTTDLLLAWDAQRPRSQQAEMGMSRLGSCRRHAGYHLQGYPPDEDYQPRKIKAVLGTSVHEIAAAAARMFIPGARVEDLEVHFAGLKGHPDLYVDGVLRDLKTLGYSMQLQSRQQLGPQQRERWQAHTYAAALILEGTPVHTVEIDYIARDSGEEWIFSEPFDYGAVQDAMNWLEQVRSADVSMLPRDYRPDSAICADCPWFTQCWEAPRGTDNRTVLFRDNPEAWEWVEMLVVSRARKKAAEEAEADAKGALDALRTVTRPGEKEWVAVPGLEQEIRFSVGRGKRSPDMGQIAMDYKNAGARPPMNVGEPVVSIALVKPKPREDK